MEMECHVCRPCKPLLGNRDFRTFSSMNKAEADVEAELEA